MKTEQEIKALRDQLEGAFTSGVPETTQTAADSYSMFLALGWVLEVDPLATSTLERHGFKGVKGASDRK